MKTNEIENLLSQMTLAEKIGQMTQLGGEFFQTDQQEITGPIYEQNKITEEQVFTLGSVIGVQGVENIKRIQTNFLQRSRLKIPLLFMADVIHGARTIFPISLGLATSWNPELAKKTATVAANEATATGLQVTFSPMVDLARDARWGRVMESTGEDAYLNSLFAQAFVEGFQGENQSQNQDEKAAFVIDKQHLASCVKHFAGYGAVEAGREYNIVDVPENKFREFYLPSYQAAVKEAGAKLVMTSFNTVNGIPATGNLWLMRQVLRDEWQFDGVLITDYGAVNEMIDWGYAADEKDAALKALLAGVDIEMMTTTYMQHLEGLVAAQPELEKLIDEAVLRILKLKNELGLFDDPTREADPARETAELFTEAHKELAYQAACESIVLLKNDTHCLPLKDDEKVVFAGPFADSSDLLGGWSWRGKRQETASLGSYFAWRRQTEAPSKADKVVLFVGEPSSHSGEAKSYSQIQLPPDQVRLIQETAGKNSQLILVVLAGRPLDLSNVADYAQAIFYCYYPGTMAAKAISDLLYGQVNPSAKLTMSLPRAVGQLPLYYNHYNTGRPTLTEDEEFVSRYQDVLKTPLYAFGHGLSYTTFNYSDASIKFENEKVLASVKVKNSGSFDGAEIVQVYVHDLVASTVRPVKELKAFAKIFLKAGEARSIELEIDKSQLEFYNFKNEKVFEPGEFEIFIGSSSDNIHYQKTITVL